MRPETLKTLTDRITENCTAIDSEERFDAMLDECYSFDSIGGPFAYMSPSQVLKEVDPTAYRCGVNDWADGEEWVEIEGSYYDKNDVEAAREEVVSEMESELSDLETLFEEEENDENPVAATLRGLQEQIDELRAEIAAVEKHSF